MRAKAKLAPALARRNAGSSRSASPGWATDRRGRWASDSAPGSEAVDRPAAARSARQTIHIQVGSFRQSAQR